MKSFYFYEAQNWLTVWFWYTRANVAFVSLAFVYAWIRCYAFTVSNSFSIIIARWPFTPWTPAFQCYLRKKICFSIRTDFLMFSEVISTYNRMLAFRKFHTQHSIPHSCCSNYLPLVDKYVFDCAFQYRRIQNMATNQSNNSIHLKNSTQNYHQTIQFGNTKNLLLHGCVLQARAIFAVPSQLPRSHDLVRNCWPALHLLHSDQSLQPLSSLSSPKRWHVPSE